MSNSKIMRDGRYMSGPVQNAHLVSTTSNAHQAKVSVPSMYTVVNNGYVKEGNVTAKTVEELLSPKRPDSHSRNNSFIHETHSSIELETRICDLARKASGKESAT